MSITPEPQKYTLEQAAGELKRRECESYQHRPYEPQAGEPLRLGYIRSPAPYFCECGLYRYDPRAEQ